MYYCLKLFLKVIQVHSLKKQIVLKDSNILTQAKIAIPWSAPNQLLSPTEVTSQLSLLASAIYLQFLNNI